MMILNKGLLAMVGFSILLGCAGKNTMPDKSQQARELRAKVEAVWGAPINFNPASVGDGPVDFDPASQKKACDGFVTRPDTAKPPLTVDRIYPQDGAISFLKLGHTKKEIFEKAQSQRCSCYSDGDIPMLMCEVTIPGARLTHRVYARFGMHSEGTDTWFLTNLRLHANAVVSTTQELKAQWATEALFLVGSGLPAQQGSVSYTLFSKANDGDTVQISHHAFDAQQMDHFAKLKIRMLEPHLALGGAEEEAVEFPISRAQDTVYATLHLYVARMPSLEISHQPLYESRF